MLSPDLYKRLLRGEKLAAELPPLRAGHRRYITVSGVKSIPTKHPNFNRVPWLFRVSGYELREELLDEHPGLESLRDFQSEVVGEDHLEATVERLAGQAVTPQSASIVDAPW
ncbi:hypothetical protein [Picosynechococcus sp. PCC 73109]|uniref:hypothetical protein n=1 Tax=Picosynechococcus sp. PCC 73109 TaxID=374982 RepID=UPI0007459457|nr:hypothetical protein [Picosynechococcus sp. PCC 73109]AMA08344.1 hypothetical protein AWQ23_02880 [Picosynechococcus sp. PCC 73109]